MAAYGAPTMKRQYCYANSPHIRRIDRGKLQKKPIKKVETAAVKKKSSGVVSYTGTKSLRGTEKLG